MPERRWPPCAPPRVLQYARGSIVPPRVARKREVFAGVDLAAGEVTVSEESPVNGREPRSSAGVCAVDSRPACQPQWLAWCE